MLTCRFENGNKTKEIKWWSINELSNVDFAFDHGETIKLYLEYRKESFDLPLLV